MNRRTLLATLSASLAAPLLARAGTLAAAEDALGKIQRPRSFWKPLLPEASYKVLFEEDTERAFTSPLYQEHRDGTFVCAACHQALFASSAKYESGTGWPSFFRSLPGAVDTKSDRLLVFARTEYHCSRCGGHHGHLFDDGPAPTGKRYCNNGVALRFVPAGEPMPELRG